MRFPDWMTRSGYPYNLALMSITRLLMLLAALIAGVAFMVTKSGWSLFGFAIVQITLSACYLYFWLGTLGGATDEDADADG